MKAVVTLRKQLNNEISPVTLKLTYLDEGMNE